MSTPPPLIFVWEPHGFGQEPFCAPPPPPSPQNVVQDVKGSMRHLLQKVKGKRGRHPEGEIPAPAAPPAPAAAPAGVCAVFCNPPDFPPEILHSGISAFLAFP